MTCVPKPQRNHRFIRSRAGRPRRDLRRAQFPSIGSQKAGVAVNADTSVDVYFGPTAPPGKEGNWVQTWPGKGWNVIPRLYGPLQPWFDKTWKPGEIEEMT
ncbi:hypothetical protein ACVJGD_005034 [Bradyrhizobium sp. USDA 10063]